MRFWRNQHPRPFRPLYHKNRPSSEIVLPPHRFHVLRPSKSIQIHVHEENVIRLMLLYDAKGRRRHAARNAQCRRETLRKRRLPGAKVAFEADNIARL